MAVSQMTNRPFRSPDGNINLGSILHSLPKAADAALLAEVLAECATPGTTLVVGVTGSVAAGKTTLCSAVAGHLRSTMHVDVISTDGFLLPNDVLAARGLTMRKGYPESYDIAVLSGVLQRARFGAVRIPGYSHATYDRAPELDRTIERPEILIVEGLGFSLKANQRSPAALLDLLVYVDASEDDLESWFVRRFMGFWHDAGTNPNSFYARFRSLSQRDAEIFARQVWAGINLPNLRQNIAPLRQQADILVEKAADHGLRLSLSALALNA